MFQAPKLKNMVRSWDFLGTKTLKQGKTDAGKSGVVIMSTQCSFDNSKLGLSFDLLSGKMNHRAVILTKHYLLPVVIFFFAYLFENFLLLFDDPVIRVRSHFFQKNFLLPQVIIRVRAPCGQYRSWPRQRVVSRPPPPQQELVSCLAPPPQGAGRRRPPDALLGKDPFKLSILSFISDCHF